MQVRELMVQHVRSVSVDAMLQAAARAMKESNVGILPVVDGGRLVGVVTDRDITIRATAEGLDPTRSAVRSAMTPQTFSVFEDQSLAEAARIMVDKHVHRLLVVDRHQQVVGILSLDDLARLPGEESEVGTVLRDLSVSKWPRRT